MRKRKRLAKAGTPDALLAPEQLSFDLGALYSELPEIKPEPLELPDLSLELPRIDPVTLLEINLDLRLDLGDPLAGLQIGAELPDLTGGQIMPAIRRGEIPILH